VNRSYNNGYEYEHLEYTPYGETWFEESQEPMLNKIAYKFTGKELDTETGLYYFGARYYDPKTSRWASCDPAFEEYLPKPMIDEESKRYNSQLPGFGGVFNNINLNPYQYGGNNPIKYTDPDGRTIFFGWGELILPRPLVIPNGGSMTFPTLPGEVVLPPITITPENGYTNPNVTIPKVNDIDWNDPPKSPDELGDDWEDVTHPEQEKNSQGSKDFKNKKTGEKIRWDPKNKKGEDDPHWHRYNPKSTGKKDYYLDKNNNPVPKGSAASHLRPKSNNMFNKIIKWFKDKFKGSGGNGPRYPRGFVGSA